MSETTFRKTRKKVVASALVCGLLSLGFIGGTYAALSASISTEAGDETLVNNLRYLYAWTVESEPIFAEVTPVAEPESQIFVKGVSNQASVPSHFAVWVSGVDVADIPASILDNTTVRVTIDDGVNAPISAPVSLRNFLTSALVFMDENWEPFTLAARTDLVMTVEVTAPTDDGTVDYSDVLDFESAGFVTNVTFNQVIGGTSDLIAYANDHSSWGGDGLMGVPLNGAAFTF